MTIKISDIKKEANKLEGKNPSVVVLSPTDYEELNNQFRSITEKEGKGTIKDCCGLSVSIEPEQEIGSFRVLTERETSSCRSEK